MRWFFCMTAAAIAASHVMLAARQEQGFRLVPHEVATGLRGGYQVVAADMNRDGRPDLIAVASSVPDLVWFENPGWERRILATGLRGMINVAAADLDGDGIPELALAHGFAMTVAGSEGNVSLLTHGADVRQPWSIREIDRVPTSHRLRWFKTSGAASTFWLLNAPLIGDTLRAPQYAGHTPIYMYRPPAWRREILSTTDEGVVHSIEVRAATTAAPPVVVSGSFSGATRHSFDGNGWTHLRLIPAASQRASGLSVQVSEITSVRIGAELADATVEPWHGNNVVLYRHLSTEGRQPARIVIDTTLQDAHTLSSADLDDDGRDEIIAGERRGLRSVRIYRSDVTGNTWSRTLLDAGGMAAAGCTAVDLNGDGRIDLACIGTATANLKWYENVGR